MAEDDEQFNQAFGEHTGIDKEVRDIIRSTKDNSGANGLVLRSNDTNEFTDLSNLLGRYIENNTHLKKLDLDDCQLTDEKIALLFRELVSSVSLERFDLDNNEFGILGVRSMIPLLQNSPHLSALYIGVNDNINSECFEVLVNALHGKSIRKLHLYDCNITDISQLNSFNPPNLQELEFNENNIGREGCITLSNLIQKEGTELRRMLLQSSGIDDECVEILAASLKHNAKLEELELRCNTITKRGYRAVLKLLVDVSSIESTYKSNHTLKTVGLDCGGGEMVGDINSILQINKNSPTAHAAGKEKVIKYQLNSQNRKKICEFQDIEYTPGSIVADMEPVLLPKILAMIGRQHGKSELYTALVQTAPDLLSYIDRKALIDRTQAKNTVQAIDLAAEYELKVTALKAKYEQKMASLKTQFLSETSRLTAENIELNNRRDVIDLGDSRQSATGEGGEGCKGTDGGSSVRGKKRGRS